MQLGPKIRIPVEFTHVIKVLEFGAKKYIPNGWLLGTSFDHKSNHASMSRHLAEAYTNKEKDDESGLDPLLHLAARALMEYTLKKKGVL